MKHYESFYRPRRFGLNQPIGPISGGLQTKPLFLQSLSQESGQNLDLLTFTGAKLMMGGVYLWKPNGHWKNPLTNHDITLYTDSVKISNPEFTTLHPIQGDYTRGIAQSNGMFSVFKRVGETEFEFDEEWSEKYGIGLLDKNIGIHRAAKMELIDINKNGLLDLVIGTNNWDKYRPHSIVDGKDIETRWGSQYYVPFDENGKWRGGPLIGEVYIYQNLGEDPEDPDSFQFSEEHKVEGISQYGYCTPVIADFSKNGTIGIITSSFLRDIKYFPLDTQHNAIQEYDLIDPDGNIIVLEGVINHLVGIDINGNGFQDIVIGNEAGYVTFLENTGICTKEGVPIFQKPQFLLAQNPPAKSDILPVPSVGELRKGHLDMVCGTGIGYFDYFQDVDQMQWTMKWHLPNIPRIMPPDPEAGSIQGPSEMGWGYTCVQLFDWNNNGLLDLVFSDINDEHQISLNKGSIEMPDFQGPQKLFLEGEENPFTTVWRVRPAVVRVNQKVFYYCLDKEGFLTKYRKIDDFSLRFEDYIYTPNQNKISFVDTWGGSRGRVKLQFYEWDQPDRFDLMVGLPAGHLFSQIEPSNEYNYYKAATIVQFRNQGTLENPILEFPQYLKLKEFQEPPYFGHHSCAPWIYKIDKQTHMMVGCEDGNFYHFERQDFE